MDFFLASYPRSGNTYVRLLLEHHFTINARSVWGKEDDSRCELTKPIHTVHENSRHTAWKTHWPVMDAEFGEKDKNWPAILIVRDGRDVLVSHAHYQKSFWNLEGTIHGIIERMILPYYQVGGSWTEFHNYWLVRGNYIAIKYEELLKAPLRTMKAALDEIHVDWHVTHGEPLPSFDRFNEQNPKFFRKGKTDSWREDMNPELEELFWKHHGAMMENLGYER